MSLLSPVDYFLATDEELRRLENQRRIADETIIDFDDFQAAGMNLVNPHRLRNSLISSRDFYQTAMNNRVDFLLHERFRTAMNNRVDSLLRGNSSLETSS